MTDDDIDADERDRQVERMLEARYQRELAQQDLAGIPAESRALLQRLMRQPLPDPVETWKRDADERERLLQAETRRRHRQESREAQLEQDVAELHQLLIDALALVDQLMVENNELKANGKRHKPKRSEPEIISLPAGFLDGPRHHPELSDVRVTQPIITRRR
jgi:hypothetical protein